MSIVEARPGTAVDGDGAEVRIIGPRFVQVPEDLLYDPGIDSVAVRLWAILARHGDTAERCYPSHERLAELAGLAARSVRRPLVRLERAGWIEAIGRDRNRGNGWVYRCLMDQKRCHDGTDSAVDG